MLLKECFLLHHLVDGLINDASIASQQKLAEKLYFSERKLLFVY
jgi:hypothetical protein